MFSSCNFDSLFADVPDGENIPFHQMWHHFLQGHFVQGKSFDCSCIHHVYTKITAIVSGMTFGPLQKSCWSVTYKVFYLQGILFVVRLYTLNMNALHFISTNFARKVFKSVGFDFPTLRPITKGSGFVSFRIIAKTGQKHAELLLNSGRPSAFTWMLM